MRTEAGIGLYFRAGPFVHLDVDFAFTYDTDHMMTAEDIGPTKIIMAMLTSTIHKVQRLTFTTIPC